MPLGISIASLALSLVISIVAATISITQMKSNISFLQKQQAKTDLDMVKQGDADTQAVKELTGLLILVKEFIAEQTVINQTVSTALDGMVHKIETVEKQSTENAAVSSLLVEVLKRNPGNKLGGE
jgi:hypothetical protein